jgi:TonB family protein
MLSLPILNVRLRACAEDWQQMTPTAQGHYCAQCSRTVLDFTEATQPELEAAFLNSPDGRVCGRFRAEQLAPEQPEPLPRRVALRPRQRRFLVALLLVCGLGLSAREAVGQVRKSTGVHSVHRKPAAHSKKRPTRAVINNDPPVLINESTILMGGVDSEFFAQEDTVQKNNSSVYDAVWSYVDQMPAFPGGHEAMQAFLQKNLRWPENGGMICAEGRVFVKFIVGKEGRLRKFEVLKGLHPLLDAEAVRVAQLLDGQFTPGIQDGRPVDVYYTVAVTFSIK